jgi:hypothetical protein
LNDVLAGLIRFVVRALLVAVGLVFFLSLLVAALVLALVWGLRALWAQITGRPIAPWTVRIDPRAGWSTVYRSSARWRSTGGSTPSAPEDRQTPAHLRPLPGADEVTDVQPREPGGS